MYDDAPKKSASDEFKYFSNDYSVRANDQYNDDLIDDPPIKILPLGGFALSC